MKNVLGALVLFFAFSMQVNAQEKITTVDEKIEAKTNLAALKEVVTLEGNLNDDLFRLFEYKYKNLNSNPSADKKVELAKIIEAKLRATLTNDQMLAIEKKEGLLKKLTH